MQGCYFNSCSYHGDYARVHWVWRQYVTWRAPATNCVVVLMTTPLTCAISYSPRRYSASIPHRAPRWWHPGVEGRHNQ